MISQAQAIQNATLWVQQNTPELVLQNTQPEEFEGQWLFTLGTGTNPNEILLDTPPLAVNQNTGDTDWFSIGVEVIESQAEQKEPTDG